MKVVNARELRIGNLVYAPGLKSNRVIDCLDIRDCFEGRIIKPFEGIPLTPEWLERAGFEYADGFVDDYTKQPITLYNNPFKEGWTVENLFKQQITEDMLVIKYVHQLQNLCFALTGEELTIK